MTTTATKLKKCIDFGHYTIVKHSETNFVVMYNEEEIASADSFASACQKTTLLEIGFKHGEESHDK